MNKNELDKYIKNLAEIDDIGEFSDGYHTFNGLYHQRAILFAALVNAYKGRSWKSWKHEDGELCFGGGWFIVGIDTPLGSYTYHYEEKYWDMFDCAELEVAKHWDGHTEDDAETRLLSLKPEWGYWLPITLRNGEWVKATEPDDITGAKCSVCGKIFDECEMANYCPNCGSKLIWDMWNSDGVIRHASGSWKDEDYGCCSCSECGYRSDMKYNYCTKCGAKME